MSTRTFVAVELGPPLDVELAKRVHDLRQRCPALRWVDPANIHLTLTFLGDLDETQLANATEAALAAATRCRPFCLYLDGLGTFGSPQMPRVVWAAVNGDLPVLHRLQVDLLRELAQRKLPADDHPFSPHLTLARLKQRLSDADSQQLRKVLAKPRESQPNATTMWVEHIAVMKSQLAQPSARYTRLVACPLLGGATA
ncbi:MAG: RNA 2',3'-cyclic phosphodiesterase [Ktedonobacterales bacterium]